MYLKRQQEQQGNVVDAAQTPPLARHTLPTSDCTLHTHDTHDHMELGSLYEIDHIQLPPRTPFPLRSARVVMVSEKTELNVSVRFPSIQSLQKYINNRIGDMYPELDERFVMGTKLAEKVLHRKVPSQEFAEKKNSEEFWLVISNSECGSGDVIPRKDGACLSLLNCAGMVSWGVRRQVKFIGRHMENNPQSSSSIVRGTEKAKSGGNGEENDVKEEEEEEEEENEDENDEVKEEEEEAVTEETNETKQISGKRKRYSSRLVPNAKKAKREKQRPINKNNKSKNKCKQIIALKNPQDRWSAERYMLAEKNLLEVMKAKGAVYGNPILRPSLRLEARKRIGDTGLLDHLLKHMAGKVAPGGAERFRRRHNAEGAMEYWLEDADLVDIRRVAGVQDPYWTPPPGWKPGDCPTQDPVCAKELKQLKEETSKLKRDMEEMVTKKWMELELAKLRREMEELLSSKEQRQQESQAIGVPNPSVTTQKLDLPDAHSLMVPLKSELEQYKEQLMIITKYVTVIEEEIGRLKSMVDGGSRSGGSALMEWTEYCDEKEKKKVEEKGKGLLGQQRQEDQRKTKTTEKEAAERTTAAGEAAAEEKAAKIRRLKSGFRICKPQGTFLWPNMVRNHHHGAADVVASQVAVQVEDLFVVPTPPSVSSSSASAPPQLPNFHHRPAPPPSPVKPLPERRAVRVTLSSAVGDTSFSTTATRPTTTATKNKTTTLINLNEFPTATSGSGGGGSNKSTFQQQEEGGSSAASSGGSCLTKGVENWLALATPTPALDDSTCG